MSNRDRIADFIRQFPGRDDDEIAAVLRIQPRQTVNQVCRALVKAGVVERRAGPSGKLANYPRLPSANHARPRPAPTAAPATASVDATADWYWEGNVTAALADFLERTGWSIVSLADTRTRQRGVDIDARLGDTRLVVEVKGYPPTGYRDPARTGEVKRTNPTNQAQHWYAHALLKGLRLQHACPEARVMLGFPDFPRYRSLFEETRSALRRLRISIAFVDERGEVELHGSLGE